jgi:hypothetical protein
MSVAFSQEEWRLLQFAVLDVLMMVSQIEGEGGIDELETQAFYGLLQQPELADSALLQEVVTSLASDLQDIMTAHQSRYKFDPLYFENAFKRVGTILDTRLSRDVASQFKKALAFQVGGLIADAAGPETPSMGRVGETELRAVAAIAEWLGTENSPLGKYETMLLERLSAESDFVSGADVIFSLGLPESVSLSLIDTLQVMADAGWIEVRGGTEVKITPKGERLIAG